MYGAEGEVDWENHVAQRTDRNARLRQENNVKPLPNGVPNVKPPIYDLLKDEFDVICQIPCDSLHNVYLAQKQMFGFWDKGNI